MVHNKSLWLATVASALLNLSPAVAREQISIVGSSTVYPFATIVAERLGKSGNVKTPKVESTGSGGGIKLFCAGVGENTPDIANSSRRMKLSEFETCQKNGVTSIIEMKIGYDGIVIANAKKSPHKYNLTLQEVFLALAKNIPAADGSENLIPNPHKTWKEVNDKLPNVAIKVLGPPPTSGTRDAFVELAMDGGCKTYPWLKALEKTDKSRYEGICHAIREDGAFVEAGENDNLIVQKLVSDPNALGIFGFSFLLENQDKIQGSLINGVEPAFEMIASGKYSISRPLYFYVKKAHLALVPGLDQYMSEFISKKAIGEEGYLIEHGLIAMPKAEFKQFAAAVKSQTELAATELK